MTGFHKHEIYQELQGELEERKQRLRDSFFSEDYISIDYSHANGWIFVDWKGYQTEKSVMTGCEKMLEAMEKFACSKVLNDNTNVLGIWTPAAAWVGSNWFPRMITSGLRQFAWVYSPSAFSRVSTDESLKHTPAPRPDIIRTFYRIDDAREWLSLKAGHSGE